MDELVTGAEELGITLTEKESDQFAILLRELKTWNAHTNLTAIREDRDIIKKHFVDSLSVLQAIPSSARTLIDIGTGAGFPGIPLAIMRPNIQFTLVESVGKKVNFITHVIGALGITNVSVYNGRAEAFAHDPEYREKFDVAVARAVAELRVLVEYTLPFITIGGVCIAQKTTNDEELSAASQAISTLGGSLSKTIPVSLAGLGDRQLIIIEKTKKTPPDYPRQTGLPAKKPL